MSQCCSCSAISSAEPWYSLPPRLALCHHWLMSIAAAVTCAVTLHLSIQGGSRVWTAGTSVWLIGLQCPFSLSIFAKHFRFLICSFWMWQAFFCRKTVARSSKYYTLWVSRWWEVRYSVILHGIIVFAGNLRLGCVFDRSLMVITWF